MSTPVSESVTSNAHGMETSALGPIDPSSVLREGAMDDEVEKSAPWIVRKLVGSMPGRVIMSSYESIRATGTSVVCLSPWGDANPMTLPCIRFRDVVVHTIVVATGGMAAVAAPVMAPVSEVALSSFGGSIIVQLGLHAGFSATTSLANDLVISKPVNKMIPVYSNRLKTTAVKVILVTVPYKHTMADADLGFFRSSVHTDQSLFASVQDYLAVGKGWFSPYLFASGRRPIIPRSMKPDVIFCHGPFIPGDYKLGETLLNESAMVVELCDPPPPLPEPEVAQAEGETPSNEGFIAAIPNIGTLASQTLQKLTLYPRSRTPSPEPCLTPLPKPVVPRRIVIVLVGIKPHRSLWTTSARPGESVMNYILFDGCPAVVVPVKVGAPLVAWDGLTLDQLWKVELPKAENNDSSSSLDEDEVKTAQRFEGIARVISEFVGMCVEWPRVKVGESEEEKKKAINDAIRILVGAAIRTKDSDKVRKEVDEHRAGIAMWRIL
jgi:hypothetical protein